MPPQTNVGNQIQKLFGLNKGEMKSSQRFHKNIVRDCLY